MKRFRIAGMAIVVLLSVSLAGCRRGDAAPKDGARKDKDQAVPVEVAAITKGSIEAMLKNSTHLEAEEEVKVFSRTSNRVTELLVEEGDEVKKDQVLVRLEDDLQKTAVAKAQVRLEKASEEFARQKALFEEKYLSTQAFKDAQFELKQLQLALQDAQRDLEYTEIRAPISGTISRRVVKLGDLVNVNQHLFDIVDFQSIVARIHLPEKDLGELRVGQVARVTSDSFPQKEFKGYVKRIAPIVESKTGTVKVTIGFKDIETLRPGMYVVAELVTSARNDAILISKRALVPDGELVYVFRLRPDRSVERVAVESRITDKLNVEPISGFKEGDEIVVAGQTGLKDGAKVRLPGDPIPGEKPVQAEKTAPSTTAKKS